MNHQELFWLRSQHLIDHLLWWLSVLSKHCVSWNRNSFLVDLYSQKITTVSHSNIKRKCLTETKNYFLVVGLGYYHGALSWQHHKVSWEHLSHNKYPQQGGDIYRTIMHLYFLQKDEVALYYRCHLSAGRGHTQMFDRLSLSSKKLFTIKSKWIKSFPNSLPSFHPAWAGGGWIEGEPNIKSIIISKLSLNQNFSNKVGKQWRLIRYNIGPASSTTNNILIIQVTI